MRMLMGILLCLASGAAALRADTVELTNGLKMEGKVHRETPEYIILLVYNEAGQIRIPREKIKKIEYDFESRAAGVGEEDYKGHFELGKWALGQGKFPEAIAEFEKVKGKEGVGQEVIKLLGQAYDRRQQLDKALENYRDYLKFQPADAEVKKRADEIAKELGLEVAGPAATTQAPKPAEVVEGLEASFKWTPEKWDNANPCTVQVTSDNNQNNNKMVVVQAEAGQKDKAAFSGTGPRPLDLSESKEITFKVFHNCATTARIAVAFINKQGEYFESKEVHVEPNTWVIKSIALSGNVFKSQKSNWKFTTALEGSQNIGRVTFLLNGTREMTLYLDNVFFR